MYRSLDKFYSECKFHTTTRGKFLRIEDHTALATIGRDGMLADWQQRRSLFLDVKSLWAYGKLGSLLSRFHV